MDPISPTSPGAAAEVDYESVLTSSLKSSDEIIRVELFDPTANIRSTNLLFMTEDDEVFFGRASKDQSQMTLDDYFGVLRHVPDEALFPEIPKDISITIALDTAEQSYCKRPGLYRYEPESNTGTPELVLEETIIMETLAKNPHPNIIRYDGCRVKRGRITAIMMEKHQNDLEDFVLLPEFGKLDHAAFLAAFESAIQHLHHLGLAHNDINPANIMVSQDYQPILVDFGSCQPFGKRLQNFGTPGWCEKEFWTSEKSHDIYSLKKLREWMKTREQESPLKSEL